MDDPTDNRKAKSQAPEMAACMIAFGLFAAVAFAPATLTVGLSMLGGLAFATSLLAGMSRERACKADQPCGWYVPQEGDLPSPGVPTIAANPEPPSSRWGDAVRVARVETPSRTR